MPSSAALGLDGGGDGDGAVGREKGEEVAVYRVVE
jgi:hypothetical protein